MSIQAYLYDADGFDRELESVEGFVADLQEQQLLWIDIVGRDTQELAAVGTLVNLPSTAMEAVLQAARRPQFDTYTDYFHLTVIAVQEHETQYQSIALDFVVGSNYVVTIHTEPIVFLDKFHEQLHGETKIGKLTSDTFLATLLDWHITSYFTILEAMEGDIDQLDEYILLHPAERQLLPKLVAFRRRISVLRTLLTPHRDVFAALARADFEVIANAKAAAHFLALNARFELAVEAIEHAREVVLGSFDLYATGIDLRTNDIVRILAIVTVVTGAASVIAGIMGMNFEIDLFKLGLAGFLAVIIGIIVICIGILLLARFRRWL